MIKFKQFIMNKIFKISILYFLNYRPKLKDAESIKLKQKTIPNSFSQDKYYQSGYFILFVYFKKIKRGVSSQAQACKQRIGKPP